jgi:hypothetical protein
MVFRAAYDQANGTPGVRVRREGVILASGIPEASEYNASSNTAYGLERWTT